MTENKDYPCVSCDSPKGEKCECFSSEEIQNSFAWINDKEVECEKCLKKFTPDLGFQPLEEHYEKHMKNEL